MLTILQAKSESHPAAMRLAHHCKEAPAAVLHDIHDRRAAQAVVNPAFQFVVLKFLMDADEYRLREIGPEPRQLMPT